ncbi:MAG: hypothetical protein LC130_32785 [Bryobacterales bacterium]|nr:hypothetical protein [Bryobacterales bacterium]MEB2361517.1 hypothetical protein [Bryobacterales bacterium]
MITSILISVLSVLLLAYWFRYTCQLILGARTSKDYAQQVAIANQLSFVDVHARLREDASARLDPLWQSLDKDYRILTYLLRHAADFDLGGSTVEQRMLMVDFVVMRFVYSLGNRFSNSMARRALTEMSEILSHFAHVLGERAASASHV